MKNVDINQWLFEIPLDDVQSEEYDECKGKNPCICCGKDIKTPKHFVHLLTTGNLISSQEDFQESQGFFPIGSDCRKMLPNNFVFNSFP